MTTIQLVSLLVLAGMLTISIWRKINIGALGYAATLVVALLSGRDATTTFSAFPASLVILIIGVTMLFAHAERSGAISWLIDTAMRPVGQRHWIIPWIGFAAGAALSTIGAFPTAPISLLLPILARLAKTYRMNYLTLAIICVWAANAAGLSPLSPAGALVQTIGRQHHIDYSPWQLYGIVVVLHAVLAAVLLLVQARMHPRRSAQSPSLADEPDTEPVADSPHLDAYSVASLISLAVLVIAAIAFKLDIGLTAFVLALLLQLAFRPSEREILTRVPWPVVLLLSGLVVYLGLLDKIGTLRSIEDTIGHITSPALLLILLAYVTAIVANAESSTLVVLGVMVPIGLGVAGGSHTAAFAVLVTVVMSAAVVAISPVHIGGALIVGNAAIPEQQRTFRTILIIAGIAAAIVPALLVLYPIAVGL
ncbi:SLC13 family permease [Nocardia sp. CA-120079]|uniref:SLC13 family permease n=1 Tax=Nocardia sp. CA-120079 TaxID=3239974 RepID=UPI003D97CA7B